VGEANKNRAERGFLGLLLHLGLIHMGGQRITDKETDKEIEQNIYSVAEIPLAVEGFKISRAMCKRLIVSYPK